MEVLHATLADRLKTGTIDEPALTTPDTTIIHPGSRSRQSEYEKVTSPPFSTPTARQRRWDASGISVLLATLSTFVPDPDDIAVRLMEQLPDYLNERFGDHGGEILPFQDLGVALGDDGEHYGSRDENGLAAIMFTRVDIAETTIFALKPTALSVSRLRNCGYSGQFSLTS